MRSKEDEGEIDVLGAIETPFKYTIMNVAVFFFYKSNKDSENGSISI